VKPSSWKTDRASLGFEENEITAILGTLSAMKISQELPLTHSNGRETLRLRRRTRIRYRTHLLRGKSLCKAEIVKEILKTWRKRRILVRNDHLKQTFKQMNE
jgi:hypothetical protein